MKVTTALLCAAVAGLFSACATPDGASDDSRTLNVPLRPGQQNLGAVAQATLVARGDVTDVRVFLSGPPPARGLPEAAAFAFIYPGNCDNQGPQPAFAMNSTVTSFPEVGGWRIIRTAEAPLEALRSGNYSIVIRTSPQDRNIDIFCGDIR
ncbi:MAG: hypothetical protein HZT41_02690 [Dechloromonas sp.]|nr:MAG: hypothetical protein HZT41_02690 [Dechloromonas sp.]